MSERTRQEWEEATLSDEWATDQFDEMLDETHEPVTLMGLEWAPSEILREMDPTAYRCEFNDWTDSMAQDAPDDDEETVEAHCGSCREWHEPASRWCPDCGALLDDMEGQDDD